jgi:hypothetical protein
MVYNTDSSCVHYYTGNKWVNLCDISGFTLTNDPIENLTRTISIVTTPEGYNLEVAQNSIRSENIVDGSINGNKIQNNSIGQDKLGADAVGPDEISDNAVGSEAILDGSIRPEDIANANPGQILATDVNGIVRWQDALDFQSVVVDPQTIEGTGTVDNPLGLALAIQQAIQNNTQHVLADEDLDATNELIVDATLVNNQLIINEPNNPIVVDLSTLDNPGTDSQTLSLADNILEISGGNAVSLVGYVNTDAQQLSRDGNIISLTNGGSIELPPGTVDTDEQDLSLDGNTLNITNGNGVDLTPILASAADGAVINMALQGTDLVVTGNGTGFNGTIPLGALTGGGTTALADQITITGDGTLGNEFKVESVGTAQLADAAVTAQKLDPMGANTNEVLKWNGTNWAPAADAGGVNYLPGDGLSLSGGDTFNVDALLGDVTGPTTATVIANDAVTTNKIANAAVTAEKLDAMGADLNEVLKWNGTNWAPAADAGGIFPSPGVGLSLMGTTFNVNNLAGDVTGAPDATIIAPNAVTTEKIANATILAEDLAPMGATDGQILKWNDGAGTWEPSNESAAIMGTENSIFFASASGVPINAEDTSLPPGNERGLFWNPTSRANTGALFVGRKPSSTYNIETTPSKVVVVERLNSLAYPLQILNESNTLGAAAGILFATNFTGTASQGKGALAYERTGLQGLGDFHFLQNTAINTTNPALTQAVMTLKNNGNVIIGPNSRSIASTQKLHVEGTMRLTEHFFDESGAQGTPGQVLSSTATGTAWINAPSGGSETILNDSPTVTVTGLGTTADPYILTATAADGSETILNDSPTVTVTGTGTAADPYVLTATAGDGSETILNGSATVTVTGTGTTADPYVLTATAGDGSETILNDSPTVTVTGTGTAADPYVLTATAADGSETILNDSPTVTVTGTGTAADPYVLTATAGDGSETILKWKRHSDRYRNGNHCGPVCSDSNRWGRLRDHSQ